MTEKSNLSQELRDIWTDAYRFHATFEGMSNSEEDWKKCAFTMGQLGAKHGSHPLCYKLFLAVYEYLEEMRKPTAQAEAERRAGLDQAV